MEGDKHITEMFTNMTAKDFKERELAAASIRNEYRSIANRLIALAAQEVKPAPPFNPRIKEYPWHDSKHLAIILLGDLRAGDGVPVLLQNLEYINPKTISADESLREIEWYPAVESLCKIGLPAVGPAIKILGELGPDAERSKLCCLLLKETLGVKLARARVQIAIEEARDETAKANLKAALPYFKTEQEKAAEERAKESKQGPK